MYATIDGLTAVPVSESQVLDLARRWRDDQVLRNDRINQWIAFGRDKYQAAERMAQSVEELS